MELNEAKLNEFLGKMVAGMGAAANGALIIMGDKLGLCKAVAANRSMTSLKLSQKMATTDRYVGKWSLSQAAFAYIEYDAETGNFYKTPEQTTVLGDENSPVLMTGAFYGIASMHIGEPKSEHVFQSEEGVSWRNHDGCLFCGIEKFFRPSYKANISRL